MLFIANIMIVLLICLSLILPRILYKNWRFFHVYELKLINKYQSWWNTKNLRGKELINNSNYEEAELYFIKLLDEIPCNKMRCLLTKTKERAYSNLAQLYKKQNKYDEAIRVYDELNDFVPRNYEYYYKQAELENLTNDTEDALKNLNRSLNYYPDYIPAIKEKLDILYSNSQYKEYKKFYEEFKEREKFYLLAKGDIYLKLDDNQYSDESRLDVNNISIDGQIHEYDIFIRDNKKLENFSLIKEFRLDPTNSMVNFYLEKIEFYDEDEIIKTISDFSTWKFNDIESLNNNYFYATSNDPYMYTDLNIAVNDVQYVTISMSVSYDKTYGLQKYEEQYLSIQ